MSRYPRFATTNGLRCWRCCPRPVTPDACPCSCHAQADDAQRSLSLRIGDRVDVSVDGSKKPVSALVTDFALDPGSGTVSVVRVEYDKGRRREVVEAQRITLKGRDDR